MPELDPFDIRVGRAVRSFADQADVRVDAMAVADRAAAHRRRPRAFGWLAVPLPVPAVLVVATLLLVSAFAWSLGTATPRQDLPMVPPPAPTPTAAPTPTPTPTPTPDPLAPGHAAGTAVLTVASAGQTSQVGGVTRTTGIVIATTDVMDDLRVSGTGTLRLGVDSSSALGFASGSLRLENAGGAWEGSCTGGIWGNGEIAGWSAADLNCWLTGSGAYRGLTYYRHSIDAGSASELTGAIVPLSPPSP